VLVALTHVTPRGLQGDELHRATNDISMLRSRISTAKELTRAEEQAKDIALEKLRQIELKNKKMQDQLAKAKDESRALKVERTRIATQYEHTSRKQEKECQKLKERLQKLVAEKNSEKKLGMRLLNSLQRPDGSRGTWGNNKGKADDDMHHAIVAQYEGRQKELALENKELRLSLVALERELVTVLNSQGGQAQPTQNDTAQNGGPAAVATRRGSPPPAAVDASTVAASPRGQYALPYALSSRGIQDSFKLQMDAVKGRFAELEAAAASGSGAPPEDQASRIEDLQRQLDECERFIEEQQAALLDAPTSPNKSFLSESLLAGKADDLERDRAEFAAKAASFEAERSALTQLAINHDVRRAQALDAIRTPARTPPRPLPAPAPTAAQTAAPTAAAAAPTLAAPTHRISPPVERRDLSQYLQFD
jgi:X breakpoint 2-interacting protein